MIIARESITALRAIRSESSYIDECCSPSVVMDSERLAAEATDAVLTPCVTESTGDSTTWSRMFGVVLEPVVEWRSLFIDKIKDWDWSRLRSGMPRTQCQQIR